MNDFFTCQNFPCNNQKQVNNYINDLGPNPFVTNIEHLTRRNEMFRVSLWTGKYLQITLMSINKGQCIGQEVHQDTDQYIRVEDGIGLIEIGDENGNYNFRQKVYNDCAFVIPAGKWHNLTNIGNVPLKIYSIYAPPNHLKGTVHETKNDDNHNHID